MAEVIRLYNSRSEIGTKGKMVEAFPNGNRKTI